MSDEPSIERVIALLEHQRGALGDAEVDFAIAALREKAGAAPRPAASASQPKLRQVSVLFCDIVSSTSMLERVTAEEASAVLGEPLARFAALVSSHGGRVLRFTGDGLKAAFGTERAREDDAVLAVRAGLAILEAAFAHRDHLRAALGVDGFAVRVGINTGPVLLGAGPEADNAAMGHVVHVAARLEQTAPPGRLRIGEGTWRAVRGHFELEPQPPLAIKGAAEPLRTFLVGRELGRDEASGRGAIEGVRARLVGRETELAALTGALERARATGRGQVATVIGDAGLGKSRLGDELRQRVPRDVTVLAGRARSTAVLQPYGVLRELVARWVGIADDEPMTVARERLVAGLAPLLGADGEARAQHVGELIGLDFAESPVVRGVEGRELRERGFRALHQALARLAEDSGGGGLLVLIDDLHWADDGTLDFLDELADREAAVAVVTFARPALAERRPGWGRDGRGHVAIDLAPLDEVASGCLAAELLARMADAAPQLRGILVERAHGNPFFMEELVQMLVDDRAIVVEDRAWRLRPERLARLRLPETLVGVLQARLDALPSDELAAIQQAAIIGPVFWDDALAALDGRAPAALPALIARSLVTRHTESAFEGCAELRFFHPLLHEVTYGTVLKAPRRAGHAHAARWLAARVGERAGEFLGLTAEHFDRAGESAAALDWFERASLDSIRRSAYEAAWVYTDRELAQPALASDPERRYWILSRRQTISDYQGDMARKEGVLADMQALVDETGSDRLRASLLATRSMHAERVGRKGESKALAREAIELAERTEAASAGALSHGMLAWIALEELDFATTERHLEAAIGWARRSAGLPKHRGGYSGYEIPLRTIRVESLIRQGRLVDAAAEIDRTLEMLSSGAPSDRHALLARRAMVCFELGDLASAERLAEECVVLARQLGRARLEGATQRLLADFYEAWDRPERAHAAAAEAARLARECGAGDVLGEALAVLGTSTCLLGDVAAGRAQLEGVLSQLRADENRAGCTDVLARLASVDLAMGDLATALVRVEEILAHPAETELTTSVLYIVWKVLRAAEDPRAADTLDDLRVRLERLLVQLPEPEARARLLADHGWWRGVHQALAERADGSERAGRSGSGGAWP